MIGKTDKLLDEYREADFAVVSTLPSDGSPLLVYNTTDSTLYVWTGSSYTSIGSGTPSVTIVGANAALTLLGP